MRSPIAVVLLAFLALCGCQVAPPSGGSSAFPADTAEDWVTYGDYLIELEAVSEVTLEPDEFERFAGEGLFRRQFTLTVRQVWWTRPGVKYEPPTSQRWVSGGWQFRNGNLERRKRINDPHQLQVGRRYVGIFTHDARGAAEGRDEWWCFGRIPVEDGRLGRVAAVRDYGSQPVFSRLRGLTPSEAGALLSRTPPDPTVVPFMDLEAPERYQAWADAQERAPR